MKHFIAFLLAFAACTAQHPHARAPGQVACARDEDCPEGWYCGFVGVDSYPVCRP